MHTPYDGQRPYVQYVEPLSIYPFSVKPEKKVSVQDIIAFQRSVFEGTIYDMASDPSWYVLDRDGNAKLSPLATPFPTRDIRELLDITYRRMVSRGGYGMVTQVRDWLPNEIGGVYWYYVDNQHVSTYVPIYAGVQEISPLFLEYDPNNYSDMSARWAVDFVDNLLYLKWQEAIKDLRAVRDPLEQGFFDKQAKIEEEALNLYNKDPEKAMEFLTNYTQQCMEDMVKMYHDLKDELIMKYTNNKQGL
jgi:dipeptidase